MRLRYLFIVLVAMLIAVWVLLLVQTPHQDSKIFYITEVVTLLCLLFLIYFYRKAVRPLNSIANGMELLHEQDFSSRLSPVGQREADQIVNIFNRMMQQMKDERVRLREQNHFLDLLINASPMGVIILDFDGKITTMNPSAIKFITEETESIGKKLCQLTSPLAQEIAMMSNDMTRTVRLSGTAIYQCSRMTFQDRGFAHPFVLIEPMTEELHRAEKNAYEKVIRMIVHEVNNTMGGITSALDSVSDALHTMKEETMSSDTKELASIMKVCEERGYNMSRFITRFAEVVKIPNPIRKPTDLNRCIEQCRGFMESICQPNNITLKIETASEAVPVEIDTTLFEQVLVNIIKNSVESIDGSGEITITTKANPSCIVVTDNGKGIDKKTERELFTPFFTTKKGGQGIGLMFIREVLVGHKCRFTLCTGDDKLTRFTILF